MLSSLKLIQENINARILRERVLIFLAAIAVLFVCWNFIIQAPFEQSKQDINIKLADLMSQGTATQLQITAAAQALLNDPNRLKALQVIQLEKDIADVDQQLQNSSQGLIDADQLPQLLQDVLQKTSQLTLLAVATLPIQELQVVVASGAVDPVVDASDKTKPELRKLGVYEHIVELRVAGNYFQVVKFLTALEALPWRFYWQQLDYQVMQYPNAEIILRVYTLSSEEGLLGV